MCTAVKDPTLWFAKIVLAVRHMSALRYPHGWWNNGKGLPDQIEKQHKGRVRPL